ncbi:MAG: VCBS repeat-containing protein, partial [Chloroflexi bacterium]|nr:VCBS repeat-containing protein [Chloroflexota bacterium]
FTDSGQSLGLSERTYEVDLGDLDGDGDLDALVSNPDDLDKLLRPGNRVWVNNGSGSFTDSGQSLASLDSRAVALGDLDGDRSPLVCSGAMRSSPTKHIVRTTVEPRTCSYRQCSAQSHKMHSMLI